MRPFITISAFLFSINTFALCYPRQQALQLTMESIGDQSKCTSFQQWRSALSNYNSNCNDAARISSLSQLTSTTALNHIRNRENTRSEILSDETASTLEQCLIAVESLASLKSLDVIAFKLESLASQLGEGAEDLTIERTCNEIVTTIKSNMRPTISDRFKFCALTFSVPDNFYPNPFCRTGNTPLTCSFGTILISEGFQFPRVEGAADSSPQGQTFDTGNKAEETVSAEPEFDSGPDQGLQADPGLQADDDLNDPEL